jgi:hypothetical protein
MRAIVPESPVLGSIAAIVNFGPVICGDWQLILQTASD